MEPFLLDSISIPIAPAKYISFFGRFCFSLRCEVLSSVLQSSPSFGAPTVSTQLQLVLRLSSLAFALIVVFVQPHSRQLIVLACPTVPNHSIRNLRHCASRFGRNDLVFNFCNLFFCIFFN